MLDRFVASGELTPARAPGALAASIVLHVAIAGVLVGGAFLGAHVADGDDAEREAILMLPLLPAIAPREDTPVEWRGGATPGTGPIVADSGHGHGIGTAPGDGRGRDRAVQQAVELGLETPGALDIVYAYDDVLDRPVLRTADGAAPRYPEALLAAGIEGRVTGEFTVDTLGNVEVESLVIVESTHPGFTEALREALPRMRFIPAEHRGRRVRQRVAQPFVFRIDPAAKAAES